MKTEKIKMEEDFSAIRKKWIKIGRKHLYRLFYGRMTMIALIMIAQVVVPLVLFYNLGVYSPLLYMGMLAVTFICILHIFNMPSRPEFKMSWLIFVAALTPFGCVFYLWVQTDLGHRKLKRKAEKAMEEAKEALPPDLDLAKQVQKTSPQLYGLTKIAEKAGGYGLYQNTRVTYFENGETFFPELLRQLKKAKKFIFLEFFILAEGYMWEEVRSILAQKVKEGVEVRLLYDGTNEFKNLPHSYPKQMEELGIRCRIFAPIRPFFSTEQNYRDHRKILVIDGTTAITGGINLADEYINAISVYGYWKDTSILLEGDGAKAFTRMFLEAWQVTEDVGEYRKYLRLSDQALQVFRENMRREKEMPGGYVLPYGDCPLDDERLGEMVYIDMLNQAREYVHIMTPYLILDEEMKQALMMAARRGVEVVLILPHIPDKPYAFALAKAHYRQLLEAGVQIYEFTPGFVHAKEFVSDGKRAVVGTINLDYRSLYHHFECACYMEDMDVVFDIEEDMQKTMELSHRITMEDVRSQGIFTRAAGIFLKLVAPLL